MNEDNMLIAKFLYPNIVFDICQGDGVYKGHNRIDNYEELGLNSGWVEQLKYHKDWNELIKVIEEIEIKSSYVEIVFKECKIWKNNGVARLDVNEILFWEQEDTKIEAVYKAIINFINWYNKQPK